MENKQDILKQLADSDMEVVKSAIEQIKQEGDISIASELLDILLRSQDTTVITNITSLLSDVKDSDHFDGQTYQRDKRVGESKPPAYLLGIRH